MLKPTARSSLPPPPQPQQHQQQRQRRRRRSHHRHKKQIYNTFLPMKPHTVPVTCTLSLVTLTAAVTTSARTMTSASLPDVLRRKSCPRQTNPATRPLSFTPSPPSTSLFRHRHLIYFVWNIQMSRNRTSSITGSHIQGECSKSSTLPLTEERISYGRS